MKYYFLALGTVVVVCVGCAMDGHQSSSKGEYHAPPAAMMQRPGPMVDGPGPGVLPSLAPRGGIIPASAQFAGPGGPSVFATTTSQVRFVGPEGMAVGWQIPGGYAENQLVAPARYNFLQAQTYRLKLANIPGREGLVIYPTLEVYPAHPNTESYLSHNSLPLQITVEDLDQVESNNFVTKVIYLPDAKFQELAIANVETLVSTRLDPGVDPVQEADKMGTIMAILRMGNMDLEMPAPFAGGGAPEAAGIDTNGNVIPVSHRVVDGATGVMMPPLPIGPGGRGMVGVPPAKIMADRGLPGAPAGTVMAGPGCPPIAGVSMEAWGMPYTGTPIGLPGPTHLPYGGPAVLKSHTVRNLTKQDLPQSSGHVLVDVEHKPGLSLPPPVDYVHYKETHPVYSPGEVAYPAWAAPGGPNAELGPAAAGQYGPGGADGAYCPPGMQP